MLSACPHTHCDKWQSLIHVKLTELSWSSLWHGSQFFSFISIWLGAHRNFQKHSTAGKTHCSNWFAGTPPGVPGDTLGSYEELRWMESPCLELLFSKIRCTQTQTQTPLAGGSPWNWMQWPPRLSTMSCGHGQAVPYLKFKHSSYHITHQAYVGRAELIHDGWLMTNGGAWALLLPSTLGL
jgi:hypothetical protein